ncbi:MAG TPA: RluA family pseudouridine synthase [Anaerolineales bacterium]|nr:RluA family pseudouridine synthase [Anaerolineales bacterium]
MTPQAQTLHAPAGGGRLDRVVAEALPALSRTRIQALIRAGRVLVDGVAGGRPGLRLEGGEAISVDVPPPEPSGLSPEPIPLEILYEDEAVVAVNKPPGMVVHPSPGHDHGTLVHAVLAHAPGLAGVGGVQRPGIVHRLDRDTSGVILVAKTDRAHAALQEAFRSREVKKTYLAIVDGHPPTERGRIEAPLGRDSRSRVRMAIVPAKRGRAAITTYTVEESFADHSLLRVEPETGRTHQIRVHLAFLGCPVTGDTVYGRKTPSLPVGRQMLHASTLELTLPDESQPRRFEAPLPQDFRRVLAWLRETRVGR